MKFWEVLPLAVEQGKKIRNDCWGEGNFVWFRDKQTPILFGEDGEPAQLCGWDLLGNWEVIEENPHEEGTGPWAAWWLKRGKVLTYGGGGRLWRLHQYGSGIEAVMLLERKQQDGEWKQMCLPLSAPAATDWRLVDEY